MFIYVQKYFQRIRKHYITIVLITGFHKDALTFNKKNPSVEHIYYKKRNKVSYSYTTYIMYLSKNMAY